MLFRILRKRKHREFDPLLAMLRATIERDGRGHEGLAIERLRELERMLGTFDILAARVLSDEGLARTLISFLGGKM